MSIRCWVVILQLVLNLVLKELLAIHLYLLTIPLQSSEDARIILSGLCRSLLHCPLATALQCHIAAELIQNKLSFLELSQEC